MCWTMNFISIILISLSIAMNCMDKPTVWDKCSQHYVTLHLSDGNNFEIKTWKILESVALYSDYLRRAASASPVKNMSLLYSTVTLPEMQLYSDLCEVNQEECDTYFKRLSVSNQRSLITVCGEYDEHHNKKLLCSGLIERLLHAYCKALRLHKESIELLMNKTMRHHIWNATLRGCVATQVVKAKLPHRFASPRIYTKAFKPTDDGCVKKIPSILMKGGCDVPNGYIQNSYNSKKYLLYRAKILGKDTAYHLTSTQKDDVVELFQDSLLLWFVNAAKNTYKPIEIKHADEIIDARFSDDAHHLFIRSAKKVQLFKLMHQDDTPIARECMAFDTAENSFANDFSFSFNKQGTLFLTSYVDGVT